MQKIAPKSDFVPDCQVLQATLVGFVHLSVVLNLPFVVNCASWLLCNVSQSSLLIFLCGHCLVYILRRKSTAFVCKNTAQQRKKCNLVFFYFLVQELSQVIHIGQGFAELIRHILCRGIGSYSHRALEILNNKFYKVLIRWFAEHDTDRGVLVRLTHLGIQNLEIGSECT